MGVLKTSDRSPRLLSVQTSLTPRLLTVTRLLSVQAVWTPGFFHQQERHHCATVWPTLQTFPLEEGNSRLELGEIDILSRYRSRCSALAVSIGIFIQHRSFSVDAGYRYSYRRRMWRGLSVQWRNDGVAAASSDGGPIGGKRPRQFYFILNQRGGALT